MDVGGYHFGFKLNLIKHDQEYQPEPRRYRHRALVTLLTKSLRKTLRVYKAQKYTKITAKSALKHS